MSKILIYPDTRLRIITTECYEMTNELQFEIDETTRVLLETSRAAAVAANQLGFKNKFFVFKNEDGQPKVAINPYLTMKLNGDRVEEGCLSFPGLRRHVLRCKEVVARYLDENFQQVEKRYTGFLAQVFQHESDHLNGVLFIDELSKSEREKIAQKMIRR